MIPSKSIVVSVILCALASAQTKKPSDSKTEAHTCIAGKDEQCPTAAWFADFDKLQALTKKYSPPQEVADLMRGMADRLQAEVPVGFKWDADKQKFVRILPPAPADAKK